MFFITILIILFATKLAGDLFVRLGQPAVVGKLVIGVIIGPALLGWVENSEIIDELSEIGVLLLMFIAGLETDINELKRSYKSSTAVALGGILLPFFGGYWIGSAIGMETSHAIFLGLLLSATSVSISVQSLKELKLLKSRESTTILGAAILDDIIVVILLAFVMSIFGGEEVNLTLVISKKFIFFVVAGLMIWKGAKWLMKWLAPLRVTESVISAGLIVCFFLAFVAEELGVAGIIGAFAAGLAVSQTTYKEEVEHKLEPIAYAIFVPIFFVSVGFTVSFQGLEDQLGLIAILTVIAILTKLVGAGLGARLTGFSTRSSLGIGSGMVSRGEVALIIATIGLESGLLNRDYFTVLVIVVILTTLVTPFLLKMILREQSEMRDHS
ncbi:cation:proton antiporter [Paenibacillus prosopidis]|uniref:Sodium/proton-potassium antiporter GerN (CPA2 family) n=1 Tax=Paenibacillus prosopidis TaxID=630520 RepID=A0A368W3D7_9BACL|nr:cation:proton antiporter [Paenibacillus prosopidis]RCW49184.1 sodium/proton-potassium antiporter GerN (CPA2 family) [Paenibacillus prosopidis]